MKIYFDEKLTLMSDAFCFIYAQLSLFRIQCHQPEHKTIVNRAFWG